MNTLPSISEHIDEKVINKIIQDNFAALAPSFYTLTSNWFVRAYNYYKDIDKFVIIIYLIHQDLIYFRQNGVKIDTNNKRNFLSSQILFRQLNKLQLQVFLFLKFC